MEQIIVEAAPRETRGKNAARRVRLTGQVPAVIYGGKVPIHTFGEAQGVKLQGGVFEMVTREVEIECLPSDIPTEFRLDISGLMIGMQLRPTDIKVDPEKIKILTDPARVLAHVVTLRVEEEKPAEVVAADATAAPAEPEVIKKGKKEAEEGEEEA